MKCSYCNADLMVTEELEYTIKNKRLELSVVGYCEKCTKTFLWIQNYTLESETDLEEDE